MDNSSRRDLLKLVGLGSLGATLARSQSGGGKSVADMPFQLFEELSFAFQKKRPSILLVFYEAESVRERAERALEKRLAEDGQPLVPFRVDEGHYDIPLLLLQHLPGARSVFSVTGLSRGGGKEGANAY